MSCQKCGGEHSAMNCDDMLKPPKTQPPSSLAAPAGSMDRDGNWIDQWGACKVCDGEIPHGHAERCDIYKLERKIAELTQLLEVTRHYRIGHEVPTEWFIKRDRAIGNPAVSPPNAKDEGRRTLDLANTTDPL